MLWAWLSTTSIHQWLIEDTDGVHWHIRSSEKFLLSAAWIGPGERSSLSSDTFSERWCVFGKSWGEGGRNPTPTLVPKPEGHALQASAGWNQAPGPFLDASAGPRTACKTGSLGLRPTWRTHPLQPTRGGHPQTPYEGTDQQAQISNWYSPICPHTHLDKPPDVSSWFSHTENSSRRKNTRLLQ